jgi:hypothetical protein
MSDCDRKTDNPLNAQPTLQSAADLEDEVIKIVEHSYAEHFTAETDLAPDEVKRIQKKQGGGATLPPLD